MARVGQLLRNLLCFLLRVGTGLRLGFLTRGLEEEGDAIPSRRRRQPPGLGGQESRGGRGKSHEASPDCEGTDTQAGRAEQSNG